MLRALNTENLKRGREESAAPDVEMEDPIPKLRLDECRNPAIAFKMNSPADANHSKWKAATSGTFFHFKPDVAEGELPVKIDEWIDRGLLSTSVSQSVEPSKYPPVLFLGNALYRKPLVYFRSGKSIANQSTGGLIQVVRLWGFAGCAKWEPTAVGIYENAARTIIERICEVQKPEGTQIVREVQPPEGNKIVLQYDGDPAWEKKDGKFSHSIMAGVVATAMKNWYFRKFGTPLLVHLLITKIDELKEGESLDTIYNKFGEKRTWSEYLQSDNADGEQVKNNTTAGESETTLTLRTDVATFNPSDAKHFYPFHTFDIFESITLVVEAKGTARTAPEGSEWLNMELANAYLHVHNNPHIQGPRVLEDRVKWNCICIGGNSEMGLDGITKHKEQPFTHVCRSFLGAMAA